MSNYTIQVDWAGKDALSDSDPEKIISGGDFNTEFASVRTAVNSKADLNGNSGETFAANNLTVAGTATITNLISAKAGRSAFVTDNDGSFDLSTGQNFTCTPTGNFTLTFTNIPNGQAGYIILVNPTGHTVSLAATTKGPAGIGTSLTLGGTYLISYIANGTNVYITKSGDVS
jgi:hypothetical protein